MYLCKPCHGEYECPAVKHELLYLEACELCTATAFCYDCVQGRKLRPDEKRWHKFALLHAYLNTAHVSYPRGEGVGC